MSKKDYLCKQQKPNDMATTDNFYDTNLIFALLNGRVSTALARKLTLRFHENSLYLNHDQWSILMYLTQQDGVTQQYLCDQTYKDKPSMTRLIDAMEKQGLVMRLTNKEDKRERLILLTKAGKDMEEKARYIANRTLKEALRGLTQDEIRTCQEVLRKVFVNSFVNSQD